MDNISYNNKTAKLQTSCKKTHSIRNDRKTIVLHTKATIKLVSEIFFKNQSALFCYFYRRFTQSWCNLIYFISEKNQLSEFYVLNWKSIARARTNRFKCFYLCCWFFLSFRSVVIIFVWASRLAVYCNLALTEVYSDPIKSW